MLGSCIFSPSYLIEGKQGHKKDNLQLNQHAKQRMTPKPPIKPLLPEVWVKIGQWNFRKMLKSWVASVPQVVNEKRRYAISTLRLSEIRWNSSGKLRWWWLLKKLCFTRVTSWERSWFNYAKRCCTESVRMETGARGNEQRQFQLKVVASHGHTVTSTEKNSNGDRWPTFVKPLWAGQRWSAVPISEGLL